MTDLERLKYSGALAQLELDIAKADAMEDGGGDCLLAEKEYLESLLKGGN